MLTLHYPLEVDHSLTRRWPEKTCFRMRGRAMSEYRPLSRRLDRCDRVIQNESRDPFGGNVYSVTMQITFLMRKFRNGERNLHCDVVHITTKWVSSLTLDCNGVFAIKAYVVSYTLGTDMLEHNNIFSIVALTH